jgi:hypothetical protein
MWRPIDRRFRSIAFPVESFQPRRTTIGEWMGLGLFWLGVTGAQAAAAAAKRQQAAFDPVLCAVFLPMLLVGSIVLVVSNRIATPRNAIPDIKHPTGAIRDF